MTSTFTPELLAPAGDEVSEDSRVRGAFIATGSYTGCDAILWRRRHLIYGVGRRVNPFPARIFPAA